MGAHGDIPRGLTDGDADLGFKPLTMGVDQGYRREGCFADLRSQQSDVIERLLGSGIENLVVAQGLESIGFVGRERGFQGAGGSVFRREA